MSEAKYNRILLKLSGEALAGEQKTGETEDSFVGKWRKKRIFLYRIDLAITEKTP